MRGVALAAAALLLAACGEQGDIPAPSSTGTASIDTAKAVVPARPGRAILDPGGVVFDGPGGKTGIFSFGTERLALEAAATRALGAPGERTGLAKCGAGPMEFSVYGPLKFNFLDGKLAGWFAEEGPTTVTSDGIRPGAMLRDLKVARSARMIDGSTLEGEFEYVAADGRTIGGFVTGEGRDARVASLHAGVNCFFR